jgi:hypothetical protein
VERANNWMGTAGRKSTRALTWTESRHATEDHSCRHAERTYSGGIYAGADQRGTQDGGRRPKVSERAVSRAGGGVTGEAV